MHPLFRRFAGKVIDLNHKMRKLTILIVLFCLTLTLPMGFIIYRTFDGLKQEEIAELRFFADTLFEQIEAELSAIVIREEARGIEEYNKPVAFRGGRAAGDNGDYRPLAELPSEKYILGYFQNNPDGTFQTPLQTGGKGSNEEEKLLSDLKDANISFNKKRTVLPETPNAAPDDIIPESKDEARREDYSNRYLDYRRSRKPKEQLGQTQKKVKEITASQAANIAKVDQRDMLKRKATAEKQELAAAEPESDMADEEVGMHDLDDFSEQVFEVEVDPMQSVFLDEDRVYIYRRIMIDNQVYRQGLVIKVDEFLTNLAVNHFSGQPMAAFTQLNLAVSDHGRLLSTYRTGVDSGEPRVVLNRVFPRPFSFLLATVNCADIPSSPARTTLMWMTAVLVVILFAGFFVIYRSMSTIMELSERRSGFVSSVTHELKTPLTNIRMYIEMLEQGVAQDPEREQEYFQILNSESTRLSRLINNVLEFSKLESRNRRLNMQPGLIDDVVNESIAIMRQKIRQEGFTLTVELEETPEIHFDKEVMIQVLINLLENSIKFSRSSIEKELLIRVRSESRFILVSVSDSGPGIPGPSLKKVFDDFYRVDSSLTRNTRGTGIGLALVKKFVQAMGGSVKAENNPRAGCTITVSLPIG